MTALFNALRSRPMTSPSRSHPSDPLLNPPGIGDHHGRTRPGPSDTSSTLANGRTSKRRVLDQRDLFGECREQSDGCWPSRHQDRPRGRETWDRLTLSRTQRAKLRQPVNESRYPLSVEFALPRYAVGRCSPRPRTAMSFRIVAELTPSA